MKFSAIRSFFLSLPPMWRKLNLFLLLTRNSSREGFRFLVNANISRFFCKPLNSLFTLYCWFVLITWKNWTLASWKSHFSHSINSALVTRLIIFSFILAIDAQRLYHGNLESKLKEPQKNYNCLWARSIKTNETTERNLKILKWCRVVPVIVSTCWSEVSGETQYQKPH